MKIDVLLQLLAEDIAQTQVSTQKFNHRLNRIGRADGELGAGAFSKVVSDRDPHLVKKYSHTALHDGPRAGDRQGRVYNKDGFDVFVRYLAEHDLMDNIHFPKVYQAKRIEDNNDAHINKYQMERLLESDALNRQEWVFVEENYFNPQTFDEDIDLYDMALVLRRSLMDERSRERYIKMDSLKEAMAIIKRIADEENMRIDMHEGNFMWRRTSVGVQLVLSDPLSFDKSANEEM